MAQMAKCQLSDNSQTAQIEQYIIGGSNSHGKTILNSLTGENA